MLKLSEYLMIKEASRVIGVTTNTLRNWEKYKGLKVYRNPLNNYRLYKRSELEEILKSIMTPSSSS